MALTSLYRVGTYPRVSFLQSFYFDPNPASANLLNGVYSDLKRVATWTPNGSNSMASLRGSDTADAALPAITAAQIAVLQGLARDIVRLRAQSPSMSSPLFRRGFDDGLSTLRPGGPLQ